MNSELEFFYEILKFIPNNGRYRQPNFGKIQGSKKHSGTWLYTTRLYSGKE